jgi:hypothetical protein
MAAKKKEKEQKEVGIQSEPSEDQVRARAYEIFQAREGGPGDAMSDWLEAEAELKGGPRIFQ